LANDHEMSSYLSLHSSLCIVFRARVYYSIHGFEINWKYDFNKGGHVYTKIPDNIIIPHNSIDKSHSTEMYCHFPPPFILSAIRPPTATAVFGINYNVIMGCLIIVTPPTTYVLTSYRRINITNLLTPNAYYVI